MTIFYYAVYMQFIKDEFYSCIFLDFGVYILVALCVKAGRIATLCRHRLLLLHQRPLVVNTHHHLTSQ